MSNIEIGMFFTAKDGSEAKIVGDENALIAIEAAFLRASIKFNEEIGTWDEGFYQEWTP